MFLLHVSSQPLIRKCPTKSMPLSKWWCEYQPENINYFLISVPHVVHISQNWDRVKFMKVLISEHENFGFCLYHPEAWMGFKRVTVYFSSTISCLCLSRGLVTRLFYLGPTSAMSEHPLPISGSPVRLTFQLSAVIWIVSLYWMSKVFWKIKLIQVNKKTSKI